MRGFAPHPNPLPMNLAIRCLIAVKSIAAKFMGRGTFCRQALPVLFCEIFLISVRDWGTKRRMNQ